MTVKEVKELAIAETEGYWEIYKICENRNYYFVFFVPHGMYDTGVPNMRINKRTKKIEYPLGCDIPSDIKQIA